MSRRTGIAVDVRVQGERSTPVEVEETLYRVVQEALANVARHSGADQAEIQMTWETTRLCLVVCDTGRGFDLKNSAGRGSGLSSMRERVESHGGVLQLSSVPGDTRVEVEVPCGDRAPVVADRKPFQTERSSS